jgi:hypothetical protein
LLLVVTTEPPGQARVLRWTGEEDGAWSQDAGGAGDPKTKDWRRVNAGGARTYFRRHDFAWFRGAVGVDDVVEGALGLADDIATSGVRVEGGVYSIASPEGESFTLSGVDDAASAAEKGIKELPEAWEDDVGALVITGAGTELTLSVAVDFAGGARLEEGARLTLSEDAKFTPNTLAVSGAAVLSALEDFETSVSVNLSAGASLEVALAEDDSLTFAGVGSGPNGPAGTWVKKTGAGLLAFSGASGGGVFSTGGDFTLAEGGLALLEKATLSVDGFTLGDAGQSSTLFSDAGPNRITASLFTQTPAASLSTLSFDLAGSPWLGVEVAGEMDAAEGAAAIVSEFDSTGAGAGGSGDGGPDGGASLTLASASAFTLDLDAVEIDVSLEGLSGLPANTRVYGWPLMKLENGAFFTQGSEALDGPLDKDFTAGVYSRERRPAGVRAWWLEAAGSRLWLFVERGAACGVSLDVSAGGGVAVSRDGYADETVVGPGSDSWAVTRDDAVGFAVAASGGYVIADVARADGGGESFSVLDEMAIASVEEASYALAVSGDHAVSVEFQARAASHYYILATAKTDGAVGAASVVGGAVFPAGLTEVADGGAAMFRFTPSARFALARVEVDGGAPGGLTLAPERDAALVAAGGGAYTFTLAGVDADHTLVAVFAPASAEEGRPYRPELHIDRSREGRRASASAEPYYVEEGGPVAVSIFSRTAEATIRYFIGDGVVDFEAEPGDWTALANGGAVALDSARAGADGRVLLRAVSVRGGALSGIEAGRWRVALPAPGVSVALDAPSAGDVTFTTNAAVDGVRWTSDGTDPWDSLTAQEATGGGVAFTAVGAPPCVIRAVAYVADEKIAGLVRFGPEAVAGWDASAPAAASPPVFKPDLARLTSPEKPWPYAMAGAKGFTVTSAKGTTVRYTLDGTLPSAGSGVLAEKKGKPSNAAAILPADLRGACGGAGARVVTAATFDAEGAVRLSGFAVAYFAPDGEHASAVLPAGDFPYLGQARLWIHGPEGARAVIATGAGKAPKLGLGVPLPHPLAYTKDTVVNVALVEVGLNAKGKEVAVSMGPVASTSYRVRAVPSINGTPNARGASFVAEDPDPIEIVKGKDARRKAWSQAPTLTLDVPDAEAAAEAAEAAASSIAALTLWAKPSDTAADRKARDAWWKNKANASVLNRWAVAAALARDDLQLHYLSGGLNGAGVKGKIASPKFAKVPKKNAWRAFAPDAAGYGKDSRESFFQPLPVKEGKPKIDVAWTDRASSPMVVGGAAAAADLSEWGFVADAAGGAVGMAFYAGGKAGKAWTPKYAPLGKAPSVKAEKARWTAFSRVLTFTAPAGTEASGWEVYAQALRLDAFGGDGKALAAAAKAAQAFVPAAYPYEGESGHAAAARNVLEMGAPVWLADEFGEMEMTAAPGQAKGEVDVDGWLAGAGGPLSKDDRVVVYVKNPATGFVHRFNAFTAK